MDYCHFEWLFGFNYLSKSLGIFQTNKAQWTSSTKANNVDVECSAANVSLAEIWLVTLGFGQAVVGFGEFR